MVIRRRKGLVVGRGSVPLEAPQKPIVGTPADAPFEPPRAQVEAAKGDLARNGVTVVVTTCEPRTDLTCSLCKERVLFMAGCWRHVSDGTALCTWALPLTPDEVAVTAEADRSGLLGDDGERTPIHWRAITEALNTEAGLA